MSRIQTRKCNYCGKEYTGQGKQFCSLHCSSMSLLTIEERFWSKVNITDLLSCWEWTGFKNKGYGQLEFRGKTQRAHRVVWMLIYGEIPDGLCVLHHCDNPSCCNPAHLFLGTMLDNNRDMIKKGRQIHNNTARGNKWRSNYIGV